jgi:hypothetical protein
MGTGAQDRRREASWKEMVSHLYATLEALVAQSSVSVSLSLQCLPRFAEHLQRLQAIGFVSAKHFGRRVMP